WDAKTAQPLVEPMRHSFPLLSAQFSPDGKRIVTVGGMTARVWNAQTGQPVTGPMEPTNLVASVRFSPDGKRIVTGSWANSARVWDAQTGLPLTESMLQNQGVKEEQKEKAEAKTKTKPNQVGVAVYSMNVVGYVNSLDGSNTFTFSMDNAV